MNKKLLSKITILSVIGTISTTVISPSIITLANENVEEISLEERQNSIDIQKYIQIAEEKYLQLNEQGEFYLLPTSSEEIPEEVLNNFKDSINFINKNLSNGNLKLEENLFRSKTNYEISIQNEEILNEINNSKFRATQFYNRYATKYKFFWWGFAAWITSNGTDQLINVLDDAIALFGASFSAGCALGNPIVIGLSVATGVPLLNMRSQAHSAKNDTGSSITYSYGSPDSPMLYKVTSSW
ncbi:hypothetical protein LI064_17240 [Clostridium perfringens]|uniref:hypothetical protein n=1 Tax=Clostridium perfringens TaxID=1502 RepID=UPI0022463423|nr:hypothetical protein [Clostridium perfringens]MCX0356250.1 hypothetical protein [Clostridium perfringens]MDM0612622.1 hypothetical protein [Clostridium perfringens]